MESKTKDFRYVLHNARLLGVFFVFAVVPFSCSVHSEEIPTRLHQRLTSLGVITGNYSADLISDGRRVHVIWQTESGVFHTSQVPGDNEWKDPDKLPIPVSSILPGRPRLLVSEGRLLLFHGLYLTRWVSDISGSEAWRSLGPILESSDPIFTPGDFASNQHGIAIAGIRPNDQLEVLIGSPRGERFTRTTVRVFPSAEGWTLQTRPSLVLDDKAIHILCAAQRMHQEGGRLQMKGHLFHFYSPDFGNTWREEELTLNGSGQARALTAYALLQGGGKLWAIHQDATGLLARPATSPLGAWQAPIPLTSQGPAASIVTGASGSPPLAVWVDNRYHEQEWWGKIPFHQAVIWDRSPDWKNNDVFVTILDRARGDRIVVKRLTPPLSYTDAHYLDPNAVRVTVAQGLLYVLRKGRSKVGYTMEQFGAPPELFVHIIPLEELQ